MHKRARIQKKLTLDSKESGLFMIKYYGILTDEIYRESLEAI